MHFSEYHHVVIPCHDIKIGVNHVALEHLIVFNMTTTYESTKLILKYFVFFLKFASENSKIRRKECGGWRWDPPIWDGALFGAKPSVRQTGQQDSRSLSTWNKSRSSVLERWVSQKSHLVNFSYLNFILLWEWMWCREDLNTHIVVKSQENMCATTRRRSWNAGAHGTL